MRTITIKLPEYRGVPVEAERISPDVLAGLSIREISEVEVWQGNRRLKLSDIFLISGDPDPDRPENTRIVVEGDLSKIKRLGEGMSTGVVEIIGNAGMHAGNSMRGGVLQIKGNADDWLGREMRGGRIVVEGDAGNYAGAGYRGERCGMRGGEIIIKGNAGAFLGEHLCGGTIEVVGDAGDFPGCANQGGVIRIHGHAHLPGAEMVKGSITAGSARVLPSFAYEGTVELGGLTYKKYVGDLVENGKGELYVASDQIGK
ncbi:MAG: formylmethanofuran dehydrogenase subunit C [Methanothrix sp.]|nr:formylmethanofuran dehydrogenase subunit C [Methanothrix sp.]MCX8206998.1 formylmethanofuran dehydrogenase subunit C [Methanothrix sp.]